MRAARSAWIVGGMVRRPGRRRNARAAARRRAGCPRRSRPRARAAPARARGRARRRARPSPRGRAARARRASRPRVAPPRRAARRRGPGARCRGRRSARRWRGGDVLDQVEQRRVGPVDVVDDEHERPRRGERLEEPAERPGGLVRRASAVARADRAMDERAAKSPCRRPRATRRCRLRRARRRRAGGRGRPRRRRRSGR